MLFVINFSGVEDGPEFFKPFYSFEEAKEALSAFLLSALAGREQDPNLGKFFPPENFDKLLKSALFAKKLSGNENSIEITFDIGGKRLSQVKKCENKDVDDNSARIKITLLENTVLIKEVKINCVKKKFDQLQRSLKE